MTLGEATVTGGLTSQLATAPLLFDLPTWTLAVSVPVAFGLAYLVRRTFHDNAPAALAAEQEI